MNTTINPGQVLNEKFNEVEFLLGVPFAVILLIAIIATASYLCKRAFTATYESEQNLGNLQYVPVEIGIEETTLQTYPTLLYSQAKLDKNEVSSCCSICLSDYRDSDMLRMLPDCQHLFHLICIDPWLRVHPTCPVCRNSPMATPFSSPLAEVIPFARSRYEEPASQY